MKKGKIEKWVTINGRHVPIYDKLSELINMPIEMEEEEQPEDNNSNSSTSNNSNKEEPEYTMQFGQDGFDIVHRHYKDRSEYDIYENGNYIDTAESMEELRYYIRNWKKQRGENDGK